MNPVHARMVPDAEQWHSQNLEHARWRVSFFDSIVQSHRRIDMTYRDHSWQAKDDLHVKRLAVARAELDRLASLTALKAQI